MHGSDLLRELLVPDSASRGLPVGVVVVGGGRDLAAVLGEHPADRPDAVFHLVFVDVVDDHFWRRSSSAAKKVEADLSISLARCNSRFSDRSFLNSSAVSLDTPDR